MQRIRRILAWAFALFFASTILATIVYRWLPVPVTPLMLIRLYQQWDKDEPLRMDYKWRSAEEISRHLRRAVVASEDQRFYEHNGFDFEAIESAIAESREGKRRRGGSTISQQTAKNVFLWPTSSWTRKGLEVYFTFLIETLWSKERILEVYLNVIEMGPGIYGAQAVARAHFSCDAKELSPRECALIAATLPAPLRYSSDRPGPYMRKRQRAILRQMRNFQ